MQLHQCAARAGLALAHELGHQRLGGGELLGIDLHGQQAARVGIERGFPQLLGVHLAQPFEAADLAPLARHAFFGCFVQNGREFAFVQGIQLGRRLFATRGNVHAKQRRARHVDVPRLDELGKVAKEQGQQQHLDVRAIDIGITQDAHLAVAQAAQVGGVVGPMGIDAQGDRNIVNLVVGKQAIALDFPGVEHLATQRQHGLGFFVAAHFGAAASAVAFHQKHLVVGRVAAFAVGELAGQHSHARALFLLYFLARALAGLRGFDGQFSQFFAVFHMLVQPQLQRWFDKAGHQTHSIARVQPLFDLALELRVEHLGRQHVAGAGKHVFGHQLHALGQQAVQLNKTFDGLEQAVAQAAVVRATGTGGNEVDVAFAHHRAVFGEGHGPGGALAFGKAFMTRFGKACAFKQRNHRLGGQSLLQVVAQAALVLPGLAFAGFFVHQGHGHPWHQHRFAAQQMRQLGLRQLAGLEITGIGPGTHGGALLAVTRLLRAGVQRLLHIAPRKHQVGHLCLAVGGDFQTGGQRIRHRHAHAVQAPRKAVGAALAFVELATGVQPGEHQLHHGRTLLRVQAKGNAPAIVFHAHRAIEVQRDFDFFAKPGQCLIGSVVQNFLDDVQRVVGAGVHTRALLDGLQPLENANRAFGIGRSRRRSD